MADDLVRLTVSIPGRLAAALEQRCLLDGDSLCAVVADALALHLDERQPEAAPVSAGRRPAAPAAGAP